MAAQGWEKNAHREFTLSESVEQLSEVNNLMSISFLNCVWEINLWTNHMVAHLNQVIFLEIDATWLVHVSCDVDSFISSTFSSNK